MEASYQTNRYFASQMKPLSVVKKVQSVNFHLWEPCNMRCGFCFATFQDVKPILPKGHLELKDCISVVDLLAQAGFAKITFAGGEPTLCPWLSDLIKQAKLHGLTTSIVTNGTRITDEWLRDLNGRLDWIALSVDTVDPGKLRRLGRTLQNNPISEKSYLNIISMIKQYGIRLKINTVVTSEMCEEDLTGFIRLARPERWKVFQVLAVKGQNDKGFEAYAVTESQFAEYVERNRTVENEGIVVVPESNDMMTGSYVMVDPSGRFFDNVQGTHSYSRPIIEVGAEEALKDVTVNPERFLQRGGKYHW